VDELVDGGLELVLGGDEDGLWGGETEVRSITTR
jgi:hypothetical protein